MAYKVYCNSVSIYTLADESLTMIDPVVTLKANCAGAFSFTLTPAHPYYNRIKKLTDIITVKRDDEEIFSGRVLDDNTDFFKQKKFTCEGELAYFNDSVQRPAQYSLVSPESFLSSLISNHNAQVDDYKKFTPGIVTVKDGDVSNTSNEISRYTNYETTAVCINEKLLKLLGGVLRVRKENGIRYLDYLEDYPEVSTQEIVFGSNLLDFSKTISTEDISTCCIPLGATKETSEIQSLDERITCADANNGSDYVYIQDAVDLYGKITKTVTWENVTEPKNLVTKAKEWLTDAQYENLVIQAKIIDLHMTDKEISTIRLLQKVRVFSKPHDLNKYFPVTELELHLNDPGNDTITLGSSEKAGTLTASTVQSGETITQMIEKLPSKMSLLEKAKENASSLIENATTGFIMLKPDAKGNPEELLIMDTNDTATATKVWRWNINGLGYSGAGYHGQYETAITMDGSIVADFITAGTMTANRIKGGMLSLGGLNNINGSIEILDANGKTIGNLDQKGLTTSIANITGGFININTTGTAMPALRVTWDSDYKYKTELSPAYLTAAVRNYNNDIQSLGLYGATNIELMDSYTIRVNIQKSSYQAYNSGGSQLIDFRHGDDYTWLKLYQDGVIKTSISPNSISTSGTKSRIVDTNNYDNRLLYCYEMPEPIFGDVGEATIDDSGTCYIQLDDIFAETIDLDCKYQVFLQKYGEGECYVSDRENDHFIVKGTKKLAFGWEIKARQKGFDNLRMEKFETSEKKETTDIDYTKEADSAISEYIGGILQ